MITEPMVRAPAGRSSRRCGFAVLEVIVALACITTLVGLASYAYLAYRDRAFRRLCHVLQTDLQKQIDGLEGATVDGPMEELYDKLVKADSRWSKLSDPGADSGSWNHYFVLPGTRRISCIVHDTYDPASR